MSKKSISREEAEIKEGKPQITNEVPENKLQGTQQIAEVDDALNTKGSSSSFSIKKTKGRGSEVKTEQISDAITGSGNTTGMGINASGRSASGTMGGVLGASNSAPQAEKSRSSSRVGKKLDRIATKLNYTPSETVLLEIDESKPLADATDSDQGYNGTYRNEFARSQKNNGAVPADLLYQRSVDYILKDKAYFAEGQMVFQTGDDRLKYYPSSTIRRTDTGTKAKKVKYHLGDYFHRKLHFGLTPQGKVNYFYADVEDITPDSVSAEDANMASAHRIIKMNSAELDRMNMDSKAGDEKADIWSCLPRAIDEPTKAAALMSSIEADTGAYCHLAYSKATVCQSFQLNRGPKDGLDEVSPAIDQLIGWRRNETNSDLLADVASDVVGTNYIFNQASYEQGDPALMIAAYDSVSKYHNKADLLLQPRGFRMHLQTADNNMNPLKVPTEYANVYAATETYSTIDHEYDPLLPIEVTDKANLILAHNLNELCAFKNHLLEGYTFTMTYDTTNGYAYNEEVIFRKSEWPARLGYKHFVIAQKITKSTNDFATVFAYDSTNHRLSLTSDSPAGTASGKIELIFAPIDEVPTGYLSLVNADYEDLPDTITLYKPKTSDNKITTLTTDQSYNDEEYIDGGYYSYEYSDLRNNYVMDVKHPLINGIISYLEESIGAKFYSLLKTNSTPAGAVIDLQVPMVFSTCNMTLAQLLICAATPWITRVRENSFKDVIYYEDNVHEYPYSRLTSISKVPFKNYVNFGYSDYDSPLESKIMNPVQAINWTMPEFFWKIATEKYVLPWYFNENDLDASGDVIDDAANMSMPSIRSGVRLALLDNLYGMTEKDIRLSLDRMTKTILRDSDIDSFNAYKYGRTTDGQIIANLASGKVFSIKKIMSAPRELGLSMDVPLGVLTIDPDSVNAVTQEPEFYNFDHDGTATSYRVRVYTNKYNNTPHPTILSAGGVNITRASNYVQQWYALFANNATANTDLLGLVFGMGDDAASYSPIAVLGTGASAGSAITITSYMRSLNTRLQFLPFIISPFDGNYSGTNPHDIYDFAYMFGLCGFRASDYRESVYNREKRVVNEGLLFVSDPWIEDSPIIKGASVSTGLKESKGYELK